MAPLLSRFRRMHSFEGLIMLAMALLAALCLASTAVLQRAPAAGPSAPGDLRRSRGAAAAPAARN